MSSCPLSLPLPATTLAPASPMNNLPTPLPPDTPAETVEQPVAVPVAIVPRPTWGAQAKRALVTANGKPLVHSWSSMVEFENCAWRWKHTKLEGTAKEGQSTQMREGNERHKALEIAVRDGAPLPPKYATDQDIVDQLRAASGEKHVEWQWGMNRNWQLTGFFDTDVWVRGKIDVLVVGQKHALAIDYKTGNRKDVDGQLELFSIPTFVRFPFLSTVRTAYYWLAEKKMDPATYGAEDLHESKANFGHRMHTIEHYVSIDKFPKIPSGLCKWCPVGRERCEYWQSYRGDK